MQKKAILTGQYRAKDGNECIAVFKRNSVNFRPTELIVNQFFVILDLLDT